MNIDEGTIQRYLGNITKLVNIGWKDESKDVRQEKVKDIITSAR